MLKKIKFLFFRGRSEMYISENISKHICFKFDSLKMKNFFKKIIETFSNNGEGIDVCKTNIILFRSNEDWSTTEKIIIYDLEQEK